MHIYRARGAIIEWELTNTAAPAAPAVAVWRLLSRQGNRVLHWWSGLAGAGTVTGAGDISSGEAFGSPTVSGGSGVVISGAGGIASGEAFGSPTVSSSATAALTGAGDIPSEESFGAPAVAPTVGLPDAGGIPSAESFGLPALTTVMPSLIVVEDGTAKADAETYISLAEADAYFAARGVTGWAASSQSEKEAALRLATEYMVQTYRMRWRGNRTTSTQALDWPRANVPMVDGPGLYPSYYASNVVPVEVRRACAELALKSRTAPLVSDVGQAKKSVKVGPIGIDYADGSMAVKRYLAVDRMLAPLLVGAGGLQVVRC